MYNGYGKSLWATLNEEFHIKNIKDISLDVHYIPIHSIQHWRFML